MNAVIVNIAQSKKVGQIVKSLNFKTSFLNRPFLQIELDDNIKAAMYYYAVGICHQTYQLANKKLQLFGWDFLEYGFMEIAREKPQLFDARHITSLSARELIQQIKPFFAEDHKPEKCSLDHLSERVELWKDMAVFMKAQNSNPLEFIKNSKNKSEYFYQNLSQSIAYSDPFQKKTSFLMKILEDARMLSFDETQGLIPIMDYHMQRVLMRTGCIEIKNQKLKLSLQKREPLNDDTVVRKACIESMKIIAKTSGYSVFKMNDVFYTLGRSCCNENMLCQSHTCEKTPCTLSLAVELGEHHKCIFQDICKGAHHADYRKYWQPTVNTHYY